MMTRLWAGLHVSSGCCKPQEMPALKNHAGSGLGAQQGRGAKPIDAKQGSVDPAPRSRAPQLPNSSCHGTTHATP